MQNEMFIGKIKDLKDFPLSYDKIGPILPENRDSSYEYWGQQWLGMPHYYGIFVDNINRQLILGIWDKGELRVVLSNELEEIINKCWRFQTTTFYHKYAFAGEIVSRASHSGNSNDSTSRFGIAFCNDGIYFGEFPACYKMKRCIGKHYDGRFNQYEGVFNLPIDEEVAWCDEDGGAFPF